jgi:hypothetical protein
MSGIVSKKISAKNVFDVVYKNLALLQSESFAKDATAMTLNVTKEILRCMRSVIIGIIIKMYLLLIFKMNMQIFCSQGCQSDQHLCCHLKNRL